MAADFAVEQLTKLGYNNFNVILHVDNCAAAYALRKGAGTKTAAAVIAANCMNEAARRLKPLKYLYINTKRNPSDILSRIGRLERNKKLKNLCLNAQITS